jgi:hypothetical protein
MENNGFADSKPYTVKFPGKSKSESTNRPVSMPFSDSENSIKNPFIIPGIKKLHIDPQLCPDKTFNNFVEGDCNVWPGLQAWLLQAIREALHLIPCFITVRTDWENTSWTGNWYGGKGKIP